MQGPEAKLKHSLPNSIAGIPSFRNTIRAVDVLDPFAWAERADAEGSVEGRLEAPQVYEVASGANESSTRAVPGPESSKALCSARTTPSTRSCGITQEILIGEVEIISMFKPSAASTPNTFAATPGCERIPAPTIDTLP